MIKILSISNSFGVDSHRYFAGIAKKLGKNIKVVTLYIGGCDLWRHYRNMLMDDKAYEFHINGINTGLKVTMKEALLSDNWTYVTFQQSSGYSGSPERYYPYINELSDYVKKLAPTAKQYLLKTWGYAEGAPRFSITPFETRAEQLPAIAAAYAQAAEAIAADGVIPAMDAMACLYDEIGDATYRDGFHSSYGVGRYMLGCLWCSVFLGVDVRGNSFSDFDVEVSEEDKARAERIAYETAKKAGFVTE